MLLERTRFLPISLFTLIFVLALLVYFPRAANSPQESDGAEFATAAYVDALVHPPGYPSYMLLAKKVVKLFPADPYLSLARFSAFLQSLAVAVLFFALYLFCKNFLISFLICLSWLFYEPSIRAACDAEVFALHNLLVVLLIAFSVYAYQNRRSILLYLLIGLISGLAVGNHHTIVFWAPFVIILVFAKEHLAGGIKGGIFGLAIVSIGGLLGSLVYLSLLPGFTTGQLVFPPLDSYNDLFKHFIRDQYGTFSLMGGGEGTKSYFFHFIKISFPALALVILAIAAQVLLTVKKFSTLNLALALTCLANAWFARNLVIAADEQLHGEFIMRFYSSLIICGLPALANIYAHLPKKRVIDLVLALGIVLPLLISAPRALQAGDVAGDQTIGIEIDQILAELPRGAVFLAPLDRIGMGLHYQQLVFGRRKDVVVIPLGLVNSKAYRSILKTNLAGILDIGDQKFSKKEFAQGLLLSGRKIFSYREVAPPDGLQQLPLGVTWQWLDANQAIPVSEITERLLAYCARFPEDLGRGIQHRLHSQLIFERVFIQPLLDLKQHIQADQPLLATIEQALLDFRSGQIPAGKKVCSQFLKDRYSRVDLKAWSY